MFGSPCRWVILMAISSLALLSCIRTEYQPNPDPNHTHADFAVWVDGEKMDFSGDDLMSTDDHHLHDHLHLHDGIGHVVHRHKPGLTLRDFFDSLPRALPDRTFRMFVSNPSVSPVWKEIPFDLDYVFEDMEAILMTTALTDEEVSAQREQMTSDACLYSRTCLWRGNPPAENCIADPAVPCVAP